MEEDKNLEFVVLYETFKQDINKKDLLQPELIVKAIKKKKKKAIFMPVITAKHLKPIPLSRQLFLKLTDSLHCLHFFFLTMSKRGDTRSLFTLECVDDAKEQ